MSRSAERNRERRWNLLRRKGEQACAHVEREMAAMNAAVVDLRPVFEHIFQDPVPMMMALRKPRKETPNESPNQ